MSWTEGHGHQARMDRDKFQFLGEQLKLNAEEVEGGECIDFNEAD